MNTTYTINQFLIKNDFKIVGNTAINDKCKIIIHSKYYELTYYDKKLFSLDLNIYWLIGVLTYNKLINKNYEQ